MKLKWRHALLAPTVLRSRVRGPDLISTVGKRRAACVSLDVFDTALLRTLSHPDDVFALAAYRAKARYALSETTQALIALRVEADRRARQAARDEGRGEITFAEIYERVAALASPAIADRLSAEELATELDVARPNPLILDLYNDLRQRRVRVVFLSDTPMAIVFIEKLLRRAGFEGDLEVHTSSELGLTKSAGTAYAALAEKLDLAPSQILHIGDNLNSDLIRAKKAGFDALWLRPKLFARRPEKPAFDGGANALTRSLLDGIAISRLSNDSAKSAVWKEIGLRSAGPMFIALTQWLLSECQALVPDHIYFCARDALIIKEFYDRLARTAAKSPPSSYLLVSRRSIAFPMFKSIDAKALDLVCKHYQPVPVWQFLNRVGLSADAHISDIQGCGLERDQLVQSEADDVKLAALIKRLEPSIIERTAGERNLLTRYLAQQGLFAARHIALSDIGWRGTIQRALAELMLEEGYDIALTGLYFGTNADIHQLEPNSGRARGWIQNAGVPQLGVDIVKTGWTVLELLFTAEHGTVAGYADCDGRVAAKLGAIGVDKDYATAAGSIQKEALALADDFLSAFGGLPPLQVEGANALRGLQRLIENPSLAQAKAIGDLLLVEGFGADWGQPIARPADWVRLVTNPKAALDSYRTSQWRRGYLTRLLRSPGLVGLIYRLVAARKRRHQT